MTWSDDRRSRACLLRASGGGMRRVAEVVAEHGAEEVWGQLRTRRDSALAQRAATIDPDALQRDTLRLGLRFIVPGDDEWPAGLDDLAHAEPGRADPSLGGVPLGLWLRGGGDLLGGSRVALVGSRASSSYGERVASDLGATLALSSGGGRPDEQVVVSGGAYGIDAAAHRGALAVGTTMAVLAGGLDEVYPRGNEQLLRSIADRGLLVSEVAPGGRPTKAGFLARNRVIAALCAGVVVVEAAHRSGALNTAAWATRIQRPVMAVPGPVTSTLSQGTNRLIRLGEASLVTNADEIRELVTPLCAEQPEAPRPVQESLLDSVPEALVQVRECLMPRRATSVDDIVEATGLRAPDCLAALNELAELGLVRAQTQGWVLSRPQRLGTAQASSR